MKALQKFLGICSRVKYTGYFNNFFFCCSNSSSFKTPVLLRFSSLLNSSAMLFVGTIGFELGEAIAVIIVATIPISKPMLDVNKNEEIRPIPAPIAHAPKTPIFFDVAKKDSNNVAINIIATPPTNISIDSMSRIFKDECREMSLHQSDLVNRHF